MTRLVCNHRMHCIEVHVDKTTLERIQEFINEESVKMKLETDRDICYNETVC